jgi:structural protein KPP10_ORF10
VGFKAWNINDLAISLNAIQLDDGGYGDDEVFSLEWDEEQFADFTGADGEVSRYNTNNFKATATLRYAQTASANDRLSAILQADLLLPNGGGVGVFSVRDPHGTLVVLAERAWITGFPAVKLGKAVSVNEWTIRLADARATFIGGR